MQPLFKQCTVVFIFFALLSFLQSFEAAHDNMYYAM